MTRGILAAMLVTAAWIVIQIAWMHVRPARNRFVAMTSGYLLSLPFVYLVHRHAAFLPAAPDFQHPLVGLIHAYLFHLLLYFFYVEGFYHVERSVTLRILAELHGRTGRKESLKELMGQYSLDDMIRRRVGDLASHGFIEQRDGAWRPKGKGILIARVTALASKLFNSKTQRERN